ncbi:MAG: alkaline phosphatase family protein [Tepidisphaeraceae bacterium]
MEAPVNQVKRRRRLFAVIALLFCASLARAAEPRVLIVSIDGCRPDVALRADMPYFRWLMRNGCFTFLATTTPAAITLPSHTSMLTGVTIERHGISGNDDEAAEDQQLKVPTIFDLAKKAGISSGMASGKSKFVLYDPPIDHSWHPNSKPATRKSKTTGQIISYSAGTVVTDDVVADHAVEIIEKYSPRLMFVHFGYNDSIGHSKGWGSAAQVAGLANTDAALGRVIVALKDKGVLDQTTIILSADHGGAGRVHGAKVVGSAFIPWIIVGPGVRKNVDLSQYNSWPVQTYDTFATACDVLGLQTPPGIDGTNVAPAFEATDLLSSTTRPTGTAAGSTTTPATQP